MNKLYEILEEKELVVGDYTFTKEDKEDFALTLCLSEVVDFENAKYVVFKNKEYGDLSLDYTYHTEESFKENLAEAYREAGDNKESLDLIDCKLKIKEAVDEMAKDNSEELENFVNHTLANTTRVINGLTREPIKNIQDVKYVERSNELRKDFGKVLYSVGKIDKSDILIKDSEGLEKTPLEYVSSFLEKGDFESLQRIEELDSFNKLKSFIEADKEAKPQLFRSLDDPIFVCAKEYGVWRESEFVINKSNENEKELSR